MSRPRQPATAGCRRTRLLAGSALATILIAFAAQPADAAGTASGTSITNTVSVDYQVGGVAQTQKTANTSFVVDDKVLLTTTKQADATGLAPSATNRSARFTLSNTGNTTHGYKLAAYQSGAYTLNNVRIYKDANANNTFEAGSDTLYSAGTNVGDIAADGSITLFIVGDVPSTATDGQTATLHLVATTTNAGTATDTTETGGADTAGSVDVVFADSAGSYATDTNRDGEHSASAAFTVSAAVLTVTKSSTVVSDPYNSTTNPKRIPGAVIHYTIDISNAGGADATSVVVSDPIVANTTYKAGSIELNDVGKTDATGDDEGEISGGTVTVTVGTVNASGGSAKVEFEVTIN